MKRFIRLIMVRFLVILSLLCTVLFISLTITGCAGIRPDLEEIDTSSQPDEMAALIDTIIVEMKAKKNNGPLHRSF